MRSKVTAIELARIVAERFGIGRRLTPEQYAYLDAHYELLPHRAEDNRMVVTPSSPLPQQVLDAAMMMERRRSAPPPFIVDGPMTLH